MGDQRVKDPGAGRYNAHHSDEGLKAQSPLQTVKEDSAVKTIVNTGHKDGGVQSVVYFTS